MKLKTKIILLSVIGITIFLLTGVAFAYLADEILGNESDKININTLYYGNILVSYDDDYNSIDISALDLNSITSGNTLSYMMKFSLENTGNISRSINIYWDNITNTFCQYRDTNYDCADPDATDYYVGDEIRASLYECNLTNYGLANISTIRSLCTKVSAVTDQALPLTDQKVKINNSVIVMNITSYKYYVAIVDIDNLATNQNYQQGKSVELGITVEFATKNFADAIADVYTATSDVGLDFSLISGPTNGEGLFTNTKVNIVDDPTQGTIKYFRGDVDNYVEFGIYPTTLFFYEGATYNDLTTCEASNGVGNCQVYVTAGDPIVWRVIRINGDNSVRMITEKSLISSTSFSINNEYSEEKFAGYTTDDTSVSTNDGDISQAKDLLDEWYTDTLATNYSTYIKQNAEFCNDTTGEDEDGGNIYYSPAIRQEEFIPTFSCPSTDKLYGGSYSLPIGTITSDELLYAGVTIDDFNFNSYFSNEIDFWTMSPYLFDINYSGLVQLIYYSSGILIGENVSTEINIRPVIELKADVIVSGSGTDIDPWVVEDIN